MPTDARLEETDSPGALQHTPAPESDTSTDLVALFLDGKPSAATRRAYAADLRDFFGGEPKPNQVKSFLGLPVPMLSLRLFTYKAELLGRGVSEATVNRRLSTVRSLLQFAFRLGLATSDGRGLVDSEPVTSTRQPECLSPKLLKRLQGVPGTKAIRGLRDTAILRLLCENALRRAELCALDVADFSLGERCMMLPGKGRHARERVPLSRQTAEVIAAYLTAAGSEDEPAAPLFRNFDHRPEISGGRLTPDGLYFLVREYGREVGVEGLTPQQLRRSAITAVIDAPGGDLRRVLRLSDLKQRLESGHAATAAGTGLQTTSPTADE
jgi:integrase/recombinase XerC